MKLPKAKFSKKIAVIVASILVVTSGTAVLAYNQNSSAKPTDVTTVATPAEEAPKEVAEVKTEPVVAPTETPKPAPQPVKPAVAPKTLAKTPEDNKTSATEFIRNKYAASSAPIQDAAVRCLESAVAGVTEWSPSFGGWSKYDNVMSLATHMTTISTWTPCYTAGAPWQSYRNGFLNIHCQKPNGDYTNLICDWE